MAGLSKVIVLDPDARAGRQVQLGFQREGVPVEVAELPREPAELALPAEDVGLVVVGGADPRALDLLRQARGQLDEADLDAPIVFAGRGVRRTDAEAAGADEVLLQPAYLRDIVTIGRLLHGLPATHRDHLVGSLAETTSVLSLVRALAALGRSAVLTLNRGLRRGEVRFYHGEVTSAHVGLIHGQAALHQLLLWTDARFEFYHEDIVRRHQIPLDRDELFADAERFLTGVRESSGRLSPSMVLEQDVARISSLGRTIPLEVHGVLRMFDGHRVLADVLEDSPYRVFETLRVAQLALEAGLVRQTAKPRPRATWRAVLPIEDWLVGAEIREEGGERPAGGDGEAPRAPAEGSSGRGKSGGNRTKGSRRRRKKRKGATPVAVTAVEKRDIDWGALVPRNVGAEVGSLAGVVPAAEASGEITTRLRRPPEELIDTAPPARLFSTEATVFWDETAEPGRTGLEARSLGRRATEPMPAESAPEPAPAAPAAPPQETATERADAAPAAPPQETATERADAAPEAPPQETAAERADAAPEAPPQETATERAETAPEAPPQETATERAEVAPEAPAEAPREAATEPAPAIVDEAVPVEVPAAADPATAPISPAAVAAMRTKSRSVARAAPVPAEPPPAITTTSSPAPLVETPQPEPPPAEPPPELPTALAESLAALPHAVAEQPTVPLRAPHVEPQPSATAAESPSTTPADAAKPRPDAPAITAGKPAAPEAPTNLPPVIVDLMAESSGAPTIELFETSDGIIRQTIASAETAPASRRPPPGDIPEDDRPEDATGEIVTRSGQRPAVEPPQGEPSILVADLTPEPSVVVADLAADPAALAADLAAARSAIAAVAATQAAAPPTPSMATPVTEQTVAKVSGDAAAALSDVEEAFFRGGQDKTGKHRVTSTESFADLDEGYRPLSFWDRLFGRGRNRKRKP